MSKDCVDITTEQFEKQGEGLVTIGIDEHSVETDVEIAPDEIHVTVYVNDPRVRVWVVNKFSDEISIRESCQEVEVPNIIV